jgi:hypothetical protein
MGAPVNATDTYVSLVEDLLRSGCEDPNDFIALACAGEELRRAALLDDAVDDRAQRALSAYERTLVEQVRLAPSRAALEQALADVLADFERLAEAADHPDPADALRRVDEVLEVTAACARAGAIDRESVAALGERARATARRVAPRALGHWVAADERSLWLGPDPDHDGLYDWLGEVAHFAPRRLTLGEATYGLSLGVRSERIERFLDRWEKRNAADEGQIIVVDFTFRTARRLAAAAGNDHEDRGADGSVVFDDGELQIRVSEAHVSDDESLLRVRVRLAPTADGDLSVPGAVLVHDAHSQTLVPVATVHPMPLLYWAEFSAEGLIIIEVPSRGRCVRVQIKRT